MGFTELALLAALALIFIGPKQLPEVARAVARLLNELRNASNDIVGSFTSVRDDARNMAEDLKQSTIDYVTKESGMDSVKEDFNQALKGTDSDDERS